MERDIIKNVHWSSCEVIVTLVIIMKLELSRQIFEKYSNIEFHANPSSWSRIVPRGRKARETDMANLIFAFRSISNAPQTAYKSKVRPMTDTEGPEKG
jgi:hypothetical protein